MDYKVIEMQKYKIIIALLIGQFLVLFVSFAIIGSMNQEIADLQIDKVDLQSKYDDLVKKTEWCLTETCLKVLT